MSVSSDGSHVEMLLDGATPDTVKAEKRGCQQAVPAGRAHQM